MQRSLQALLAESLDYAGMFPPASLPLDEAAANYFAYRDHPQAWLLGRFVCPAARLAELDVAAAGAEMPLSVLGSKPEAGYDAIAAFEDDCQAIRSQLAGGARLSFEFYETTLPQALLETRVDTPTDVSPETLLGAGSALVHFSSDVRQTFQSHGLQPRRVFFEVPAASPAAALALVATTLAEEQDGGPRLGLKIRAGGPDASYFPRPVELARFIVACDEAECTWKATAGLHEPLSRFDDELGAWRFGFLNVFAAAALSFACDLDTAQLEALLTDAQWDAFRLEEDSFAWREHTVENSQIAAARRGRLVSFGSCSFDEPVEGLAQLKLTAASP